MNNYSYSPVPDPAPQAATSLLSIAGDFAAIEGKFRINDSLHVECEIGGELDVGGRLVIGENGSVNANVRTVDALIMGSFEGNLVATGNVEIAATGKVVGNISTDSLVIARGGFFNGHVARVDRSAEREVQPAEWKHEESNHELVAAVLGDFRDRMDGANVDLETVGLKPGASTRS